MTDVRGSKRLINRRAVLASIAAAPAVGFAVPSASSEDPTLADLLDSYHEARRQEKQTWQVYEDLSISVELPKVEVTFGKARIRDEDTGEVIWGQWSASSEDQVRRYYKAIDWMPDEVNARKAADCERVLAELRRQQRSYDQARKASGLEDALEAHEEAGRQLVAAHEAIFAYRPRSLDEMDRKNTFLAELNVLGDVEFSARELAVIFGAKVW